MCQHEQTTFICMYRYSSKYMLLFFKLATTTTFVCVTVETKFEFLTVIIIILYVLFFLKQTQLFRSQFGILGYGLQ